MKRIFLLLSFAAICLFTNAQDVIAVEHNGVSSFYPTFDSAYNAAKSGDNIYLSAGIFTINSPVAKRLFIKGVGIDPDSVSSTITTISSNVYFTNGADSSSIEGIKFLSIVSFGLGTNNFGDTTAKVSGVSFLRCDINTVTVNNPNNTVSDKAQNIYFNECIINTTYGYTCGWWGCTGSISNWSFTKCIIQSLSNFDYSTFTNNIIASTSTINHSNFYNNIFNNDINNAFSCTYSNFYNNINAFPNETRTNTVVKNYIIDWNSIFIDNTQTVYKNNWHLKQGNPAIRGGNDGTDVGMYGTTSPCKAGWIPSNPHVYYKNVGLQNDPAGILHATFKVKAQSH